MQKTLTKAQKRQYAKLCDETEICYKLVCAYGDMNTRFSDALALAPVELRERRDAAWLAKAIFERDMVSQGRAWFTTSGAFMPY